MAANDKHWSKAAKAIKTNHHDEVRGMIKQFSQSEPISVQGTNLTVPLVAALARRPEVSVSLDDTAVRARVTRSSDWLDGNLARGRSIYGVNTGFGATSHVRTQKTAALQAEAIRVLNTGVVGKDRLPAGYARATMLVRINTLVQGYSGIRWEIIEAVGKLINENVIPMLPLRGTVTASGDLVPLSYVAGLLSGRENSRATTLDGEILTSVEALKRAGVDDGPFELQAKEGLALVNGTAVGAAVAATVCYDASVIGYLSVILSAMLCEAMQGSWEFTDPLTHELKHHPGQIEAAGMMKHLLDGSDLLKEMKARNDREPLTKSKAERYALKTSPQWLGPQLEVIRQATHVIEREINSVSDNPIIDVDRDMVLIGGNFQGTPIGVSMDNVRVALAAIGKLMTAQFSELVCDYYNNGLPSNLTGGKDPSLDYGLKGSEVAMASYCSELQYLANPVTTHVQSTEQHNQDVNSLGLISARKSAEAIKILKLMASTYMVALCQAIDLRHLEENLREVVRLAVVETARKTLSTIEDYALSGEKELLQAVECQPVFSYIHDPSGSSSALLHRLREVLFERSLGSRKEEDGYFVFKNITIFMEELKTRVAKEVAMAWEKFREGDFLVGNRILKSRTRGVYELVRSTAKTEILSWEKKVSPGEHIEKVYDMFEEGKIDEVVYGCMET